MNLIDYCVKIRNLDTLLFYVVILILLYVNKVQQSDIIKNSIAMQIKAFIFIVVILNILSVANVFTLSGYPHLFQNVYPQKPNNFIGWISKNIINILSLVFIFICSISIFYIKKQLVPALLFSVLIIITQFMLLTDGLRFLLLKIKNHDKEKFNFKRFSVGLMLIIIISILEFFVFQYFISSQ